MKKKPQPDSRAVNSAPPAVDESSLDEWGFGLDSAGDGWLEQLREAEVPQVLGSIGTYELLEEVSRGGQGVVFRARQAGTNRDIALKRLLAGSFASASMRLRFEREVESAAALNHPNIVTAYGMETVEGLPVFAMEWVDGVPVTEWARGAGPGRDPRDILEVFLRICDAIQHAHSRGVVHRDLKPSNILVSADGQPHVLDFGLAKRSLPDEGEGAESAARDSITRSADFLGTPAYSSPEQLQGGKGLDDRTDVYSLGVLLFEMLTGESPYGTTRQVTDLIRAVETLDPPRPSSYDPRLGREIDTVVLKALGKERTERYASVDALAGDLRRYLAGEAILALEPSSWYLMRKLVGRNRLAFAFAATVLLLITGFGAHAIWQSGQLRDERDDAFQARELAYERERLANDAADEMERLLLKASDLRPRGERGVMFSAAGPAVIDKRAEAPCADPIQGSLNPWFDPDEFEAPRGGPDIPTPPINAP